MNALVVGSGWARHSAHAFAARDDVHVKAVVGRGSPRSFDLAASLGVPLFDNLADAIAETRPALAIVAAGDAENSILAAELVRAGTHVLCAHPVAPTAADVEALSILASSRGVLVSTDYSLRATNAFRVASASIAELGSVLRIDVTAPGRFLPIALDLALRVGGAAEAVAAFGRYPDELRARRERMPAAFPPTVVLEHARGAVTALTPTPHAAPHAAVRLVASTTRGRIEVELPTGAVRRLRCMAGGSWEATTLLDETQGADGGNPFADAMHVLANDFVDAVVRGGPAPCSLEDEARVRRIWAAIPRALRSRATAVVEARTLLS